MDSPCSQVGYTTQKIVRNSHNFFLSLRLPLVLNGQTIARLQASLTLILAQQRCLKENELMGCCTASQDPCSILETSNYLCLKSRGAIT